jgi:hypothetical protein
MEEGYPMSRSYRHTPIMGMTCKESEKKDKRHARRRLRRLLKTSPVSEDTVLPLLREVSNVWAFAKDGRQYLGKNPDPRWMRK